MSIIQSSERGKQSFPPDERLSLPQGISFVRLLTIIVVLLTVIDLIRVGWVETPIPYNYPFFLGIIYLIGAIYVLPRIHGILDDVKVELVDITARTATADPVSKRDKDVSPEDIKSEFERYTAIAFDPRWIIAGALFGGSFSLGVMAFFGVLDAYPYLLMNFAYGAGHGLFYVPILGTMYLVLNISRHWIIDIDLLDPDGMGGYSNIGDALVSLVILIIAFVTFDFFIISSVSFVEQAPFQRVALIMYASMFLFYLTFTVVSVQLIRKRLLELREQRTEMMRKQFREIEQQYWAKQKRGESASMEAEHIQTMQILFSRLHQMGLWPINLLSLTRLVVSTAASLTLVAIQEGWLSVPFIPH